MRFHHGPGKKRFPEVVGALQKKESWATWNNMHRKADEVVKGANQGLYLHKETWREKRFAAVNAGQKEHPEIGATFRNFQAAKMWVLVARSIQHNRTAY